jgi:hypothetical protein
LPFGAENEKSFSFDVGWDKLDFPQPNTRPAAESETAVKAELRFRFWVFVVLSGLSAFLGLLTLASREWIEALTGVDPDHHNGSFEWLIVVVLVVAACGFGLTARSEWHRATVAA